MTNAGKPIPFPLSKPVGAIPTTTVFDVVVVGSGYGGAVVAYRLAKAKQNVALLERGAETAPKVWTNDEAAGYPNTLSLVNAAMEIETDSGTFGTKRGLFDLRVGDDVSVLVGCGLGGGSLINASVALRAHGKVLSGSGWPQEFRQDPDLLTPFYEKAERCLGSQPYPSEQTVGGVEYPALHKVDALKKAAKAVDKPFELLPINVTFAAGANHFGFQQNQCVLCGDCMTGCNYGAKNTTLMNYLPAAAAHGAQIFTGAEVDSIELVAASGIWQVYLADVASPVQAKRVVLAAGSLGSTEILLRSQAKRNLQISKTIGSRFSTNGDFLAFGYDTDWGADGVAAELLQDGDARPPIYGVGAGNRLDPKASTFSSDAALRPGPSTAGLIQYEDDLDVGNELVIEEGTLPSAFAMVAPPLQFLGSALDGNFSQYADSAQRLKDAQALGTAIQNDLANIADEAYRGPVSRTQMYLVMGHDDSGGEIAYDGTADAIRVRFPGAGRERAFSHEDRTLAKVNEALRGTLLRDPLWSDALGRQLITVHPLGGCPMADSGAAGVVNHLGQVFVDSQSTTTYGTLIVCDGSIIPTSLGVNPLLTITALAERIAENLVQELGSTSKPEPPGAEHPPAAPTGAPSLPAFSMPQIPPPGQVALFFLLALYFNSKNPAATPPLPLEVQTAANTALAALVAASGPLDSGVQSQLMAQLLNQEQSRILGEVAASILLPLDECIQAWASTFMLPALEPSVSAQFEKMVERFPIGFTPAFRFAETMHGYVSPESQLPHTKNDGTNISDPHEVARAYAGAPGGTNHLVAAFQVSTNDLHALATDPSHSATIVGTLTCPALCNTNPVIDVSGTLALLVNDPERVETSQMIYAVTGKTADGAPVTFRGVKYLHRRSGSSPWSDLTTLYTKVTIQTGGETTDWLGILRLDLKDVIALASSAATDQPADGIIDTTRQYLISLLGPDYGKSVADQIEDTVDAYFQAQLAGFFSQAVFGTYGGLLADLENFAARDDRNRTRRALAAPTPATPEIHPLRTADGFDVQLTRYNPGVTPVKPVILAPGFLTSAASFAADTVRTNVVEYLNRAGYDVWLFDYRGSPALPSGRAFCLDDIATYDWPFAIEYVCFVARVPQVRILAHCVGSLSFLMALLREPPDGSGDAPAICGQIQSAVCSQLSLHPVTNWLNYLKVDLDALDILEKTLHVSTLDLVSSSTTTSAMLDAFFWNVPVPAGEECVNPLCHRVFSVFGPSWAHAQLNADTHNALLEWFGSVPAAALEQLTTILKAGKAVDHEGRDVYLPNVANLGGIPITFIAGEQNQIFTPQSSLITLQWLREKNPASAAAYNRHVFPKYAHMDHFIGKNASTEVFPLLPAMLEAQSKKT